ncbi:MAG TPA: Yip1 family protein [Steroidobacteraceae bacterium]|jgi:hypothetical protein|nr:Yip1 family protein [Steroidobacteraceae bacterium]
MDTTRIVSRARSTLLTPKTEWAVIAAEPDTVAHLYSSYILVMAAIPAVIQFLSWTIIGRRVPFVGTYRVGITAGLSSAIVTYVFALVGVYIVALIVDALAPSFHGQKNQVQALKTVAYAYTATWVASILGIVPGLALIATLAGLIYAIYLLRVGLPFTMKCPDDRAIGYTAVTIIVAILVGVVMSLILRALFGAQLGAYPGATFNPRTSGTFAPGTPGAALEAYSKSLEAANERMQAAQQSGDAAAQSRAAQQAFGAALGNGGRVESLPTDRMKTFIPDALGGLKRTQLSATRSGAMGMQVSTATGSYSDGAGRNLQLEITDTGSLKGLVGFAAGWAGVEQDNETDSGYDKTYQKDGQIVHEKWDRNSHQGEYGVIVANRFSVAVSGSAADISDLKAAVTSVNLAGLAALQNAGVQAN